MIPMLTVADVAWKVYHSALWLLGFVGVVLVLFFLAGLVSAALEVRREKRAGKTPTRPAWEAREKRRITGWRDTLAARWREARFRGLRGCWCGCGPVQLFPADRAGAPDEWGCAAWEAGHLVAIDRHDRAGGYARVPVA